MTEKAREFINKVDTLCREYHFQIWPTSIIGETDEEGFPFTFSIHGEDETINLLFIDGDGDTSGE